MRRLGALLMIVGANMAVGSLAVAFWLAAFQCALEAQGGSCKQSGVTLFVEMMISGRGLVYWAVIVIGLLVFWRGKRMRTEGPRE